MLDLTRTIPATDSAIEAIAFTNAARVVAAAAVCAGMLACDRERYADVVRRGAR
jgi:hypothetical protein